MRRNKKISITVACVVHNNERRIVPFLRSLAQQNQEYVNLKKILFLSDGSTDRTIDEIRKNAIKKIELIVGRKKLGRSRRLNEIFRQTTSDVLVVLDIETVLKDKFVIENLVAPFRYRTDVALVGGNPKPLPPNTFLESAAQNYYQAKELLKRTINEGNNIYGVDKRILAFSRSFIEKVTIPNDIDNTDTFIYLKCKDENMEFVHQEKAIVWFRLPQSIRAHLQDIKNISKDTEKLKNRFSKDLLTQELSLTKKMRTKILLYQLLKNPPGYLFFAPHAFFEASNKLLHQLKKLHLPKKYIPSKISLRPS